MTAIIFLGLFAFTQLSQAEENESASQQVREILKDQSKRSQIIHSDPKARAADQQVDTITRGNSSAKEEMYDIAAALIPWIEQQTAGDSDAMEKLIQKAATDPAGFYNQLPQAERDRINALAKKLEPAKP